MFVSFFTSTIEPVKNTKIKNKCTSVPLFYGKKLYCVCIRVLFYIYFFLFKIRYKGTNGDKPHCQAIKMFLLLKKAGNKLGTLIKTRYIFRKNTEKIVKNISIKKRVYLFRAKNNDVFIKIGTFRQK